MQGTPFSHRLAAVWFADVAGYSARAAKDECVALQLVQLLQALSRETVRRYEGRIVKFVGDAVLAEFPSTALAVQAAAALSRAYLEQSGATGHAHSLTLGVHVGDVAVGWDGDLYGDAVNAAARIREVAEPGQVVASQDVWRQLRGRREFCFKPLGDRSLKGVGPTGLYLTTVEDTRIRSPQNVLQGNESLEETNKRIRSLGVLPFADLSAERDQEYFGDGIAEEILNALAKVGPLHVAARTSSFAFRGTSIDVREIGRRLGVDALLEGSIRKAGNRVRITVQLIDARNGYQLWSHRFDKQIENIFAIQDEIARNVIDALGLSLTQREERRFLKASTKNVEAYEFYLRARKLFQRWTRQNIELARQMFERAIELDSHFAAAWAGLATAYVYLFDWGGGDPDLQKAHNASARALELDPELADAHVAAGQSFSMEQRYSEATAEFDGAIELDPTLFDAYYYYARSCFKAGNLKKALSLFEKAHSVRPEDYQSAALIAAVLRQLGRIDEAHRAEHLAIESINRHLELNVDEARAFNLGAIILARLGDVERAKQWNERAMSLAPDDDAILYNASCVFAVLGEEDQALAGLQRAIEAGLAGGDWVSHDPDWERLRDNPRFQTLVQRLQRS